MLKKGKRYSLPGGAIVEVIEVNFSCAVVRLAGSKRIEFEMRNGDQVEFDKRHRTFTISANSLIEEV